MVKVDGSFLGTYKVWIIYVEGIANILWPTAPVIPVFIKRCTIITKRGDYRTFNIPTLAEYLPKQLRKC